MFESSIDTQDIWIAMMFLIQRNVESFTRNTYAP